MKSNRTEAISTSGVFEKIKYERDLFVAIARGEEQIQKGKGISHKKVFKDLFRRFVFGAKERPPLL